MALLLRKYAVKRNRNETQYAIMDHNENWSLPNMLSTLNKSRYYYNYNYYYFYYHYFYTVSTFGAVEHSQQEYCNNDSAIFKSRWAFLGYVFSGMP